MSARPPKARPHRRLVCCPSHPWILALVGVWILLLAVVPSRSQEVSGPPPPREETAPSAPLPTGSAVELSLADLAARIREIKEQTAEARDRLDQWERLVEQSTAFGTAYRERLDELRKLADQAASSDRTGAQLEQAYTDIKRLAATPSVYTSGQVTVRLADDRALLFEIDQRMRDPLRHTIPENLQVQLEANPEAKERYQILLDERKRVLPALHEVLTKTISRGEKLIVLDSRLSTTIAEFEDFLLPRLFWIRSSSALGMGSVGKAAAELERAATGLSAMWDHLTTSGFLTWNTRILIVLVLVFVVLPFLFVRSGTSLKRILVPEEGERGYRRLLALGLAIRATFPGLYGLAVAFLLGPDALGLGVSPLLLAAIEKISLVLLFWLPLHTALSADGLFVRAFEFPVKATVSLRRYLDSVTAAFVLLSALPGLMRIEPFSWTTIPQICTVAFRSIVVLLTWQLLRRRRPLARRIREMRGTRSMLWRNWSFLAALFIGVLAATVVGDLLGYRFASEVIFLATLRSLFAIIILTILYRPARKAALHLAEISSIAFDRAMREEIQLPEEEQPIPSGPPAQGGTAPSKATQPAASSFDDETRKRAAQLVRHAFFLASALILIGIWNVDNRLFFNLHAFTVFRSPDLTITLADFAIAVGILGLLYLGVRSLPSAFELFVFPRVDLDAGLRYAVVAIVQYTVLAIGLVLLLLKLQVDFDKLGWLVAALGVGLGFGLQEIVSNFVSGIILLVERPIRVGDIVKIGDTLGIVSRINIRSTTITDWNRLENVYPNKDFITQQVTNWTLTSKLTRVVTPIGVAYGTDPLRVKNLLLEIAHAHPDVSEDPPPQAMFMGHGDSALNFELRTFVADIARRLYVEDDMHTQINRVLTEQGIEIPFPQRDVHIRSMPERFQVPSSQPGPDSPAS